MKLILKEDVEIEFINDPAYFFIGCRKPLAIIRKGTTIEVDVEDIDDTN